MDFHLITADALLILHSSFVLFVVGGLLLIVAGGVRGWSWVRNRWFRLAHLAAIAIVVVQSWFGLVCPLTTWEMALRVRGGQEAYQSTFISHWLGRLLYYHAPDWVFVVAYTAFGAIVLACLWWVRPR